MNNLVLFDFSINGMVAKNEINEINVRNPDTKPVDTALLTKLLIYKAQIVVMQAVDRAMNRFT